MLRSYQITFKLVINRLIISCPYADQDYTFDLNLGEVIDIIWLV